jgi:hypothetical protein
MDEFAAHSDSIASPSRNCFAIVPHDTAVLTLFPKAVYVGGTGDIVVRTIAGAADVTFRAVPAGTILPIRVGFVRATGTTATGIVGLA